MCSIAGQINGNLAMLSRKQKESLSNRKAPRAILFRDPQATYNIMAEERGLIFKIDLRQFRD